MTFLANMVGANDYKISKRAKGKKKAKLIFSGMLKDLSLGLIIPLAFVTGGASIAAYTAASIGANIGAQALEEKSMYGKISRKSLIESAVIQTAFAGAGILAGKVAGRVAGSSMASKIGSFAKQITIPTGCLNSFLGKSIIQIKFYQPRYESIANLYKDITKDPEHKIMFKSVYDDLYHQSIVEKGIGAMKNKNFRRFYNESTDYNFNSRIAIEYEDLVSRIIKLDPMGLEDPDFLEKLGFGHLSKDEETKLVILNVYLRGRLELLVEGSEGTARAGFAFLKSIFKTTITIQKTSILDAVSSMEEGRESIRESYKLVPKKIYARFEDFNQAKHMIAYWNSKNIKILHLHRLSLIGAIHRLN